MTQNTDVVVLGAGVAGCATAYYLARGGVGVTVVERDAIGSCASGYAAGLLNPLTGTGIPGPIGLLTEAAFKMHKEMWPVLQEEADMDLQVRLMPHLELFLTPEDATDQREEMTRWSEAEGFSTQRLTPDDVHRLEPRITRDLEGAVLLESVGMLDSYRYTLALARAAEHHGAVFQHGEVVGLRSVGSRVTGVELSQEDIACDRTVIALGPWSGQASAWLGLNIPVTPLKGEIIYVEGMDPPLEYNVHVVHCNLAHKVDGMVWIGATEEPVGFDDATTVEARDFLMGYALKVIPCLDQLKLLRQTACLRPVTPDREPILGTVPGWEGVYMAAGAEKKGILISPAIGQAVADLIVKGETALPIAPFALERFLE